MLCSCSRACTTVGAIRPLAALHVKPVMTADRTRFFGLTPNRMTNLTAHVQGDFREQADVSELGLLP